MGVKANLILVRHGQSEWNEQNLFTGTADVGLTRQGREEAVQAGLILKSIHVHAAFSSALKRARETCEIIVQNAGWQGVKVIPATELNEKSFGELQGMNKGDAIAKYGREKVEAWRKSFEQAPPGGDSLKDNLGRIEPYFRAEIAPLLLQGKNVLIAGHSNSLKAVMMCVEEISPEEIWKISLDNASPFLFELNEQLIVIKRGYL